jgi:hypothetical protein
MAERVQSDSVGAEDQTTKLAINRACSATATKRQNHGMQRRHLSHRVKGLFKFFKVLLLNR